MSITYLYSNQLPHGQDDRPTIERCRQFFRELNLPKAYPAEILSVSPSAAGGTCWTAVIYVGIQTLHVVCHVAVAHVILESSHVSLDSRIVPLDEAVAAIRNDIIRLVTPPPPRMYSATWLKHINERLPEGYQLAIVPHHPLTATADWRVRHKYVLMYNQNRVALFAVLNDPDTLTALTHSMYGSGYERVDLDPNTLEREIRLAVLDVEQRNVLE